MAKRNISDQQLRRVRRRRQPESMPATAKNDGHQEGWVAARYGKQADIYALGSSIPQRCHLRAHLQGLVAGDKVLWSSGEPIGVVESILPRSSELQRPDASGKPKVVAANINTVVLVFAPEPQAHANLIDRYLVAIEQLGAQAILVLNKVDLDNKALDTTRTLAAQYQQLGYPLIEVSTKSGLGVGILREQLAERTSLIVGQSGVGKSSIINAINPSAEASVGALSEARLKGRHTTTTTRLFFLNQKTRLIDSPGIREFGLEHLNPEHIAKGFIEFRPFIGECRYRNCNHRKTAGCALQAAVERGEIKPQRFNSYLQIQDSSHRSG